MQRIEQPTLEQMMRRKANLERKQRQRDREKARSHRAIQEHLEKVKSDRMERQRASPAVRNEINARWARSARVWMYARSKEAFEAAREMARALDCPDVREGESLHDFERRVFERLGQSRGFPWWMTTPLTCGGAPHLNRQTGELSPGRGKLYWQDCCGGFDGVLAVSPGCQENTRSRGIVGA